jgi:hypothetical protein
MARAPYARPLRLRYGQAPVALTGVHDIFVFHQLD